MLNPTKIRILRSNLGLTQDGMAEKMQMSPTAYARLERGEVQPKIDKLQQLASVLKVDMDELLQHDDKSVSLPICQRQQRFFRFATSGRLELKKKYWRISNIRCSKKTMKLLYSKKCLLC